MQIENAFYRVSIKALIYNQFGEFLLCKEDNGKWDFPGGGLDHGENPKICLIRELYEEMGLTVRDISEKPVQFITAHKPNSKTRPWIANVFYEVELEDLEFTTSSECREIKFFSKETASKVDTIENVAEFIKYN